MSDRGLQPAEAVSPRPTYIHNLGPALLARVVSLS